MHSGETVAAIVRAFADADAESLAELIRLHEADPRQGVARAIVRARKRVAELAHETRRTETLYHSQRELVAAGFKVVVGVDEVGRGALAGPVTAGAALLDPDEPILGLDDSKRLSRTRRDALDAAVRDRAVAVAIVHVDADRIDRVGIQNANREAMQGAVESLGIGVDHVLVDGNDAAVGYPCTPVVGGDARCASIAAASIVAKVARDRLMRELDERHPGYGLAVNKGYATTEHIAAVRDLGPSPIHRRTFEPCRQDPTLF